LIHLRSLTKVYKLGKANSVRALAGVDLDIEDAEFVAVMGASGSGKSTLMNILGCLDRPTEGEYTLSGEVVSMKSDEQLAHTRNRKIGFVFQTFNLLPKLSALQNVELPLVYRGMSARERRTIALDSLSKVGLSDRVSHRPAELSGGQQQRVAIARAIATSPGLLLADEPTGNLDSASGSEIMQIFSDLNANGITIVLITHDEHIAAYASRVVKLRDGLIISDESVFRQKVAMGE